MLPKGTSFDDLTQSDINTLMSNINSYPREELNKCCPFNLANMLIGKNVLHSLFLTLFFLHFFLFTVYHIY